MTSIIVLRSGAALAAAALVLLAGCAAGHWLMLGGHGMGADQPVARLAASITDGPAPLGVDFDFSASHCSGGLHQGHHRFDPGDGASYTVDGMAHHVYQERGTYRARLWIEDGDGYQSSAEVVITVY